MKNITLLTGLLLTITTCSNAQVLFGDTYLGGTGNGVLFNYNTVTGRDSVDFAFNNTDGASPNYLSGVMQATDGMLYGTASSGGSAIHGVMYRFNPVTGKDTVLINFDGPKYGSAPYGSLIQCTDGLLYGMTNAGGASGDGVLYSYDPVTLKDSIRLTFNNTVSRGGYPYGPLLQAKDGYIYGMNSGGGIGGSGVLFRFDPKTNNDTILYAFPSSTSGPRGGLIQGTDGLLYGLTIHGGSSDDGTIFSYDPVKFKDSVRLSLDGSKGDYPWGNLVQAANGKMYGMTYNDAVNFSGVLFCFNPVNNSDSVVVWFKTATGIHPYGTPIICSNGLLYGLTYNGGTSNYGTLFSYNMTTGSIATLLNFNSTTNGANPAGILLEVNGLPLAVNNIVRQAHIAVYPNPFHGATNIVFAEDGKHYLEVDDITGRQIEAMECIDKQYELQRNNLAPGIYFIKAFDQEHNYIATSKIVVE